MKFRKNNKKVYILVVLLLILSMSIGYAYLTKILKINHTANIAKTTWDIHFENAIINKESTKEFTPVISEDKNTVSAKVHLENPGDYYEYSVDVINSGTIDAMVSTITSTSISEEQQKYIEYKVTYDDDVEIKEYDELLVGEKETIKIIIYFKEDIIGSDLPNGAIDITFETTLNYAQTDENAKPRERKNLFILMKKQAVEDTDINYGAISSDTNGKGIYKLTKIETSTPIYYYRGEVDNNVIFGGFCWKIIRTTETGGVKLIYNGVPNNGVCDATGDATEIGKSVFNPTHTDAKYVGYMYDDNTVDSIIKGVVDMWFANNLLSYQDYLEDTPFYNERDYVAGDGILRVFAPRARIWGIRTDNYAEMVPKTTIKLGAANLDDIFTVSSEIGNGALTYPVGLITSDEVVMAGGRGWINMNNNNGANNKYYLYTGSRYFTISPGNYFPESAGILTVHSLGMIEEHYTHYSFGVRPVISLKPGTNSISGNGAKESPFIIN